jgi:hypothetical protein
MSFAESVPRRESLRRLGGLLAAAVLAPIGLGTTWARPRMDPCKAFCNKCPRKQQSQCLAACQACSGDTSRLCGSCDSYTCCASGSACCDGYCADLNNSYYNCGACGYACNQAGPNEVGMCLDGDCHYQCVSGTTPCDGTCIPVMFDPDNCGACGQICPESAPFCTYGTCTATYCNGADLNWDSRNCGACGNVCPEQTACAFGVCEGICYGCG